MSRSRVPALLLLVGLIHLGASAPHTAAQQNGAPAPAGADGADAQQPAPADGDQPIFRGGIDFVRVDVVVSDGDGQPVLDLEAADFELREDGEPQPIEQFRAIRVDGNIAPDENAPREIRSSTLEEAEAQRDDVRLFVFFLDDYHVRDSHAIQVRQTLVQFIQTQLGPNDMLAVMYPLTPADDVIFTRDHDSIVNAISRFQGRKYDYTPINQFERNYERAPTSVIERIRNEVVMSALEALSQRLGGLRDGRKSVVLVSEGFTVLLPPQMRRNNAQGVQLPSSGARDPRVEDMAELAGIIDLEAEMRLVYRAANRNNTSIYSLDPRGLAVFEFDIADSGAGVIAVQDDADMLRSTQDTLRQLSRETDGRAIINRNTLAEGLAEMVRDSSYYYLLGYTSDVPTDGKFHEIDVRVQRRGVQVRARRGFWALSPENVTELTTTRTTTEVARPVLQALATISPAMQAARFVRTWVGTERGENGNTRVTLVWEPLPAQPGVRREEAGSVSLLALNAQGDLVYRGRSPEEPSGGTNGPGPGAAVQPQRVAFEAPPGRLDVRLSIDAAGGGTLDSETRTIDVPDLGAGIVALSTPRVYRARTARDFRLASEDPNAVPVAAREFSRTERLLIRFDAYGPGSETPTPVAALLGRNGKKISDLPVSPAKTGGTHQVELPLNTMAAGEYLVEISLAGATGEAVSELVAFRLGA